jgi:hypothetical protein
VSYRWQARDEEELAMLTARGYSKEHALELIGQRINTELVSGEVPQPAPSPHSAGGMARQSPRTGGGDMYAQQQQQQRSPYGGQAPMTSPIGGVSPAGRGPGMQRGYSNANQGSVGSGSGPPSTQYPPGGGMRSASKKMGGKSVSQEDLETALLLSEQEARFGTNMFEAMRPGDEDLVGGMTAGGAMRRNEALKVLFDSRYDRGSQAQVGRGYTGGRREEPRQGQAAPSPGRGGGGGGPAPLQEDEFEKALRLSAQESDNFRPGVQRVEGFATRSAGQARPTPAPRHAAPPPRQGGGGGARASEADVQSLCSMGFPRGSALDALDRCNNDIGAAAEYLLGNG